MPQTVEQEGPRRTVGKAQNMIRHLLNSALILPERERENPVVDTGVCTVQTQPWLIAQEEKL